MNFTHLVLWTFLLLGLATQIASGFAALRDKALGGYLVFAGLLVINVLSTWAIWSMMWFDAWPTYMPVILILSSALIASGQMHQSKIRSK